MEIKPKINKLKIGILLNSFTIESWVYEIINNLLKENYISVDLVVLNDLAKPKQKINKKEKTNRFSKIKNELNDNYLFYNYLKWDKNYYKEEIDAFEKKDSAKILENIETISVTPRRMKFSDFIEGEDLKTIQTKKLDVIIRFGFRILKGGIFNSAKYGVWSYHHDDNIEYRGGPGLFWEIYENNPKSGTILQILNEKLDDGKVIYRSISNTKNISYHKNRNQNYWKTSTIILRRLKHLHLFGWEFIKNLETYNEKLVYNKGIYTFPNNKQTLKLHYKLFVRNFKFNIRRHFFEEYWEIIFKTKNKKFKIKPKKGHWYADPFPIKNNDKIYLFFEDFNKKEGIGCISFVELYRNNKVSKPKIALKENFHLSYPHVFEYEGCYYMIPESKENNSIRLYKAKEFPYKWDYVKTLISDIKAVDSTILFHGNKVWLFTNIENHGASTWEELYIFYSNDIFGDWEPHPLNPVISNVCSSRPAGNLYKNANGEIFRPNQDCSITYGYATNISQITKLNEQEYEETIIQNIHPKKLGNYRGTHTYNKIDNIEFYDAKKLIKNKKYNFTKLFKKTIAIYHHKPIRLYLKHLLKILITGK